MENRDCGLKIRQYFCFGSETLANPRISLLTVQPANEMPSLPLIEMRFTVCSQVLENKSLASDS